ESYYNQELLPQLHHSGATEVSLAEVTPKIKEVLTQEKMNQLLTAWLKDLRAGSEIHMDGFSPPEGRRNELQRQAASAPSVEICFVLGDCRPAGSCRTSLV